MQALKIAFMDCDPTKMKETLPVVKHGDDLGNRMFFFMSNNGCKFVHTPVKLIANANGFPTKKNKKFYILTKLGGGKVGQTYLACDTSGRLAAIKLFIPHWSEKAVNTERHHQELASLAEKGKQRDEELRLWNKFYPHYGAFKCVLDTTPALVMQYGQEIKLEDREESIPAVRKVLMHFARTGWKYDRDDLRWRHVFRDHSNVLFLGDLGSLQCFSRQDTVAITEVVSAQIESLKSRISEATVHSSCVDSES